jgi:osmotically-inducible protein OsmY
MKNTESNLKSDVEHLEEISSAICIDVDLSEKVRQILKIDFPVNNVKISIRVFGRTVYLEGMVSSEQERKSINEAAMNIFGVRNVVNYLTYPCPYITGNYPKPPQKHNTTR